MAEASICSVVEKLGDLLIKEAVCLYDIGTQIELVNLQLHQMQCFLKDAASKQKQDERVKGWVKDIRDVAYETEDAIDEYLCVVARSRFKGAGFITRKPVELYARHKLGKSIAKVQNKLQLISQGRITFGIKNLVDERSDIRPSIRGPVVPDGDGYEIVGFKDDQRNIISQIVDRENMPRRQIISIVGQGGLGKTTLVHKVYNSKEVKGFFKERIWLTVTREFKLNELLKKVLDKLGKTSIYKETEDDSEYLMSEVKQSLRQKRYLIVFDDVWTVESIDQFQRALPDDKNGSRVLMTARFSKIAKQIDPGSMTHELKFLNEEESLQLLLAKAFPYQSTASKIPDDLTELAKKLAKKCGGLPLALVVIGGLLSMRTPTYNDWYQVYQTLDWQSNGIGCMKVLATSYEDLPYSLKPCFLYFGCFPENSEIRASSLLRMWIAEGFIQSDGRRTLEDTAECYLEELIQR
jgi:NB-ARC domain/Rx N-terminal domain